MEEEEKGLQRREKGWKEKRERESRGGCLLASW